MSFTDKITISYSGNGAAVTSVSGSYVGDQQQGIDEKIPAGSTNLEFDLNFPVATLHSFSLVPTIDLVIKTNNSSTPGDTLNLKAGVGITWGENFGTPCPFSVDVTKFFVTTPSSADGRLNGRFLWGPNT